MLLYLRWRGGGRGGGGAGSNDSEKSGGHPYFLCFMEGPKVGSGIESHQAVFSTIG
jgi:hypothetical protein